MQLLRCFGMLPGHCHAVARLGCDMAVLTLGAMALFPRSAWHIPVPLHEGVTSFIHSRLKIHGGHEALSCRVSLWVSVRHTSLAAVSRSGTLFTNTSTPRVCRRTATLAYGWHGASWMCAVFCCPENRLILAQGSSPFTAPLPPMPPSQLASFHQTSDRRQRPACPRVWAGILEEIVAVGPLRSKYCVLSRSIHCIHSDFITVVVLNRRVLCDLTVNEAFTCISLINT